MAVSTAVAESQDLVSHPFNRLRYLLGAVGLQVQESTAKAPELEPNLNGLFIALYSCFRSSLVAHQVSFVGQ